MRGFPVLCFAFLLVRLHDGEMTDWFPSRGPGEVCLDGGSAVCPGAGRGALCAQAGLQLLWGSGLSLLPACLWLWVLKP